MKKKILSLVLALAMILPLCPAFDVFANGNDVIVTPIVPLPGSTISGTTGDCTWTLKDTTLTISGNGAMGDYSSSDQVPWGTSITEVVIENGVTSVSPFAFAGNIFLTSVTLSDTVTQIGEYAFDGCSALDSVAIPDSVTSIGRLAFRNCSALTEITIPDGITLIDKQVFYKCASLCSVNLPDDVTLIDSYAFFECDNLSHVWYIGTPAEQQSISVSNGNTAITTATWHYVDSPCDTTCNACDATRETATEHSYTDSCDSDCNLCGDTREVTHKYSIQQKNSENHWMICSVCGTADETTRSPHDYTDNCDPYCNTCSYQRAITHDYSTLLNSEFLHWYNCSVCGATNDTSYEEHVYDHACDTVCNVCNRERAITHSYSIQDLDDNAHWMKCAFCGGIDENTLTAHDFDNACDTTCNGCSFTRTINHDYSVAEKTLLQHWMKCSVCGEIDENTRGNHGHDNACDTTCDECGYVRQVPDHVYDNDQDLICNECNFEREAPYTPGDVDENGEVDLNDAIYLLYHVNFSDTYPVNQSVDFDSSGTVDLNDAIYLLYHVNFPVSYPLP